MRDFTQQRANLLLCTTIIETGIDIPTANTIIINRADRFGLAQLHQLRGRVGRSHHQAYAYLLTQPGAKPSAQAQKRLEAIAMMEDLGSGFYLAMHDLEIRGAGEVLGETSRARSSRSASACYHEMLVKRGQDLQNGKEPDLSQPLEVVSEISLHPGAAAHRLLPRRAGRLTLYKRLANCEMEEDLRALQEELIDRFGELPAADRRALIETHRLRMLVKGLRVHKLDASDARRSACSSPGRADRPVKVIFPIQDRSTKMAGPEKLVRRASLPANLKERVKAVKDPRGEAVKGLIRWRRKRPNDHAHQLHRLPARPQARRHPGRGHQRVHPATRDLRLGRAQTPPPRTRGDEGGVRPPRARRRGRTTATSALGSRSTTTSSSSSCT